MSVEQMTVDQIPLKQMSVNQIPVDQMGHLLNVFDKLFVNQCLQKCLLTKCLLNKCKLA
jgi:hypothetical protein